MMRPTHRLALRTGLLLPVCLLATGCISAGRYGTPRTLPEDETQHLVTAEFVTSTSLFEPHPEAGTDSFDFVPIPSPSYTYRKGLGERTELGIGVGPLWGGSADLKLQLVRSGTFDLAIAPTVGAGMLPFTSDGVLLAFGSFPVLAGFQLGPDAMLLAHFLPAAGTLRRGNDFEARLGWAAGSGLWLRVTESFAVLPALTVAVTPDDPEELYLFGLALHFGGQAGAVAVASPER